MTVDYPSRVVSCPPGLLRAESDTDSSSLERNKRGEALSVCVIMLVIGLMACRLGSVPVSGGFRVHTGREK